MLEVITQCEVTQAHKRQTLGDITQVSELKMLML